MKINKYIREDGYNIPIDYCSDMLFRESVDGFGINFEYNCFSSDETLIHKPSALQDFERRVLLGYMNIPYEQWNRFEDHYKKNVRLDLFDDFSDDDF